MVLQHLHLHYSLHGTQKFGYILTLTIVIAHYERITYFYLASLVTKEFQVIMYQSVFFSREHFMPIHINSLDIIQEFIAIRNHFFKYLTLYVAAGVNVNADVSFVQKLCKRNTKIRLSKTFTARKGHFTLPKSNFNPRFGRFFPSEARAKESKNFADKKNSVYLHQKTKPNRLLTIKNR